MEGGIIEEIVSFYRHAAQGLEERKQVLYLLGPVGSAKSTLAIKLKSLMERYPDLHLGGRRHRRAQPAARIAAGTFQSRRSSARAWRASTAFRRAISPALSSPWAQKRMHSYHGDLTRFRVQRIYPSVLNQLAVAKTEPGDENTQDISSLVGKVDMRKLSKLSQDDPDAYSYSGGLCLTTQGLLEFVEMFKAPIKVLHPLLTATQEGNFKGTEGFGAMPYQGTVLAHSNESEWKKFSSNRDNEAFLDRIFIVKVPYCLRVTEEVAIYQKLLRESTLSQGAVRAGHTADAGALHGAVADQGAQPTRASIRSCGSMTARTCASPTRRPRAWPSIARPPAATKA